MSRNHLRSGWIIPAIVLLGIVTIYLFFPEWVLNMENQFFDEPVIVNNDFSQGLSGWTSDGEIQPDGRISSNRLVHLSGDRKTIQTLTGIKNGWYTVTVWVQSSKDHEQAFIQLADYGREAQQTAVPFFKSTEWLQISVSAKVTKHQLTISLGSSIPSEGWVAWDSLEIIKGQYSLPIRGADISSLKKSEDLGGIYRYENGEKGDALQILSDHEMNYARIRVWVNSADGYHGKEQLLTMARRLKEKNIQLLVDFHYSDTWADPGKQFKPSAWEELDISGLTKAVYDHTYNVCSALVAQGTPPAMVQIGNEINNGMLWPDGKADQWENLAELLKSGISAVRNCSPQTRIMLQVAEGGDNKLFRWWFDKAGEYHLDHDVIGVSFYPYWHGSMVYLQQNLTDIAERYEKDIILVETAYPFTSDDKDGYENIIRFQLTDGYPATPEGQKAMLEAMANIVRTIPNGRGLGFFYWDATWTAVPGNGWEPARPTSGNNWENQALFDFDDLALPAMRVFGDYIPE